MDIPHHILNAPHTPQAARLYGVTSQATSVYAATCPFVKELANFKLVVELSCVHEARTSAAALIGQSKARERALTSSNDEIGNSILGYIVVVTCDYSTLDTINIPNDLWILMCLDHENHQLHVSASHHKLPIREVAEKDFLLVFFDSALCHYALWTLEVSHRDINANNFICVHGKCWGALNDFDLASNHDWQGVTKTGLTGTLPFMALDLLGPNGLEGKVPHLYRHDLESFYWVLMWICSTFVDLYAIAPPPLYKWTTDAVTSREGKTYVCASKRNLPEFTKRHAGHWETVGTPWRIWLRSERRNREVEEEEAGSLNSAEVEPDAFYDVHRRWRESIPLLEGVP
ncbi:hypothetical protein FRB95_014525 [Tulasnella sp. JGI-2019a]|nr:hypothetical protein FRB95_014525 [Tulasnella sp. JGI-2019a]